MTYAELLAKIRELSARSFSTVGDERSQADSVRQWSAPMKPYTDEIAQRHTNDPVCLYCGNDLSLIPDHATDCPEGGTE
jgi:hypothetical protein